MSYLIIISIVLAATSFLTIYPRWNNLRDRRSHFFNFLINIISTFIGLFLALYFTNLEQERNERTKTMQILNAIKSDIDRTFFKISTTYLAPFDSTYDNSNDLPIFLCRNPIEKTSLFENYINSEQIIRYCDPCVYSLIVGNLDFVINKRQSINETCNSLVSTKIAKREIVIYLKYLHSLKKLTEFEIENLNLNRSDIKIREIIDKEFTPYPITDFNQLRDLDK